MKKTARKTKRQFLCDTCLPNTRDLGPLLGRGDWRLGYDRTARQYVVIGNQGHRRIFAFPATPFPDPVRPNNRRLSEAAEEAIYNRLSKAQHERFARVVDEIVRIDLPVQTAVDLHADAQRVGYDRDLDGYLLIWLFHRAGYVMRKKAAR